MLETSTHASPALAEAERLMIVCNACRYCEGLCAVFPAMEMRRTFADGDLDYLANLCHSCGACFTDCQFAPPHEFNVNVPKVLAQVREESWGRYAWPGALRPVFDRNGLVIALATALGVGSFIGGFVWLSDRDALFRAGTEPGAFYRVMPHNVMAASFAAVFLYACIAIAMSVRSFWRTTERARAENVVAGDASAGCVSAGDVAQAGHDAATLRYLGGGGAGCSNSEDVRHDRRRLWHHLTFYGFLLCFASTSVATLYHYLLGREAPYPWWDAPVVLGTLGGIGLLLGPAGLLLEKTRRDPALRDGHRLGMDVGFTLMLFLTSLTGLALLLVRATAAMGLLLALHLGVVLALFVTLPYGKFVHGIYRAAALVRYARERRMTSTR